MKKNEKPKEKQNDKEVKDGEIPRTFSKQNLGHNAKQEGFNGPHTKR